MVLYITPLRVHGILLIPLLKFLGIPTIVSVLKFQFSIHTVSRSQSVPHFTHNSNVKLISNIHVRLSRRPGKEFGLRLGALVHLCDRWKYKLHKLWGRPRAEEVNACHRVFFPCFLLNTPCHAVISDSRFAPHLLHRSLPAIAKKPHFAAHLSMGATTALA